jgi:hypothetical protein
VSKGSVSNLSNAQKALGWSTLGVLALSLLHEWFFEALVNGPWPERTIERLLLEFPAYLPYLLAPYLVVQAAVLVVWAVRSPRAKDEASYGVAVGRLAEWLKWSLALLAIIAATAAARVVTGLRLTTVFMMLIPLFGWAYLACAYLALQVQEYRFRKGRSAVKPSDLAIGVAFPAMVMPLWPLGLLVPAWVSRQAKVHSSQQ